MPFAVLKTLCTDMPRMMGTFAFATSCAPHASLGCGNYSSMCVNGTEVQQCAMTTLPIGSTSTVHGLIVSMCGQMPGMSGCSTECIGCTRAIISAARFADTAYSELQQLRPALHLLEALPTNARHGRVCELEDRALPLPPRSSVSVCRVCGFRVLPPGTWSI